MSLKRFRDSAHKTPLQKGPGGRNLCRWCGGEVRPPRRTFCSAECVHEHSLRTSGTYLREHVFKRDRGVCALCGLDAHKLWCRIRRWRIEKRREYLAEHGFHESCTYGRSLWEADHVVAVVEGGGECGLDNIRTLCVPCHKKQSAGLRKRLAGSSPPLPVEIDNRLRFVLERMHAGDKLVRNAFAAECRLAIHARVRPETLRSLIDNQLIRKRISSRGFTLYAITQRGRRAVA